MLVLVYVGAVMVLFLFVVMMLDISFDKLREGFWRHLPLAGGRELQLVGRAVDLDEHPHRHVVGDPLDRGRDRRQGALVTDQQVPVGGQVGGVAAGRPPQLQPVPRLRGV